MIDSFPGLKVTQDARTCQKHAEVHRVRCRSSVNEILFDRLGEVGWGGNGGFQALNLVVQFGARKIILVGYDMTLIRGAHWHGRHQGLNNPSQSGVDKWRARLDAQATVLRRKGIDVIIGSPNSSLTNYRRVPLLEALANDEHSSDLAVGHAAR